MALVLLHKLCSAHWWFMNYVDGSYNHKPPSLKNASWYFCQYSEGVIRQHCAVSSRTVYFNFVESHGCNIQLMETMCPANWDILQINERGGQAYIRLYNLAFLCQLEPWWFQALEQVVIYHFTLTGTSIYSKTLYLFVQTWLLN